MVILNLSLINSTAQPFNGFMSFDGINDEFSISGYPIPSNSNFTIEFWFRPCNDTTIPLQVILGNSDNLEICFMTMFTGQNTYELCAREADNSHICHQDHQFNFDQNWHHLAVTYVKALDKFNIFYDGIDGTIAQVSYNFSPFPSMTVGVGTYQMFYKKHFKGYLDEMRISNIVRYSSGFTPPVNSFVADVNTKGLWHFDEVNPVSSVIDYSGNGFNLVPAGNPKSIQLNNLVVQSGISLSATMAFDTYQWINCETGQPIQGSTSSTFTPLQNGYYAVMVSDSSCQMTSDCYHINNVALADVINVDSLLIYPDPVTDILHFKNITEMAIEIVDCNGIVLISETIQKGNASVKLDNLSSGIYFIKFFNNEKYLIKKIIKM